MRLIMTIPFLVMIVSALMWLFASAPAEKVPWWRTWFIDVCRVLFAASALVVLFGLVNKLIF